VFTKPCKNNFSSDKSFWLEVKKLKGMFYENGYPIVFFDKVVQKFLSNKQKNDEKKKYYLFYHFSERQPFHVAWSEVYQNYFQNYPT